MLASASTSQQCLSSFDEKSKHFPKGHMTDPDLPAWLMVILPVATLMSNLFRFDLRRIF